MLQGIIDWVILLNLPVYLNSKIDEDPYAHLRYDPGWREADVEKSKSAASQRAGHEETACSHDTR